MVNAPTPIGPLDYSGSTRVLHAVDDLGLDPNGNEPIDATVESELSTPGTLIEFPDGDFLVGEYLDFDNANYIGMRAADGASPTLVPGTQGSNLPGGFLFIRFTSGNFEFGGFDIDFTRNGYYGEIICDATVGDAHVHDIRRLGLVPGTTDGIWLTTEDSNGVVVCENVNMRDGARGGESATGLQVRASLAGECYILDCDMWHFPSKGIYASSPAVGGGGTVHVDGGHFKNNNDSDVRIGSAGSTVENIVCEKVDDRQGETVTWDRAIPLRSWEGQTGIVQTRSIRLKDGSDVTIRNCDFTHEIGEGVAVIKGEGSHAGGTTIEDCRFRVDTPDINALVLDEGPYTLDNVNITGTGTPGQAIVSTAPITVRNSCISLSGAGQNGIVFQDVNGYTVENTSITVPGAQIVEDNASGTTSNIVTGESCALPGGGGGGGGGGDGGGDDGGTGGGGDGDTGAGAGVGPLATGLALGVAGWALREWLRD